MDKLREKIVELFKSKDIDLHEFWLDEIMDIVNDSIEDAFYDSRDRHRPSMCDWQYIYDSWEDYKKLVLECEDKK